MANTPKKPQRASAESQRVAVAQRRASTRRQHEQRRQRLVIGIAGGAIGIAVLAILIGFLYNQLYLPSRPVASVGGTTLSRGDYNNERRRQIAREIQSTLDLLVRFGNEFGQQFAQRIPDLNTQANNSALSSAAVDDDTINSWIDQRVIERGAASLNIQASEGEVVQQLVSAIDATLPPPSEPVTGTATTEATAEATATVSSTDVISASPTLEPTPTLVPTPGVEAAVQQEDDALRRLYDAYTSQIVNARPNLSLEDFREALRDQYRRQVLTEKVQAQLVPEEGFTLSTEPTSIEVRHILVKVEVPEGSSDADRAAAFEERRADAEAILREAQADNADFAEIAQRESDDLTSKEDGGLLPSFDINGQTSEGTQVDPAFLAAALTLTEPQQIAPEIVQTPFGWHIIQLENRVVPSEEEQLRQARSDAFDTWVQEQRTAANVERFPPQTPTATAAPTAEGEVQLLPTAPLGGVPTVVSDTTSLTDTEILTDTPSLETPTPAATPSASETTTAATTEANSTSTAATTAATSTGAATATP